ncbi:MAG: MCE family protein [Candidatus Brocadiae bacterium]|nr:MCE family protein [Candidatus Brocadiia bacterium]
MADTKYVRIGAFIVSGTLLAAAGIVIGGAGSFGAGTIAMETYLDESVQGLAVGSPVKYRGVQVGTVDSIDFVFSQYKFAEATEDLFEQYGRYVVVRLAINQSAFRDIEQKDVNARVQGEIDRGLRARIASQGLTGVAYIEIDYLDAGQNPIFKPRWAPRTFYLPAATSTAARITDSAETVVRSLEEAELDVVAGHADLLIRDLTKALNEDVVPVLRKVALALDEIQPTLTSVKEASGELAPALRSARAIAEDLEPVAKDLRATTETLPETARRANEIAIHADEALTRVTASVDELSGKIAALVDRLDAAVERDLTPTLGHLRTTSEGLPEALESLKVTLKRIDGLVTGERADIAEAVSSLRQVSRDIEQLSAHAKRYPSHVLFGNPPPPRERR